MSRDVFDELDLVLGPERGEDGTPSANDFLTIDLLPIVDAFATRFDELPELIPGRPDYRILRSPCHRNCQRATNAISAYRTVAAATPISDLVRT